MTDGPVRQGATSHRRRGARLPVPSQRVALARASLESLCAVLILTGALSPASLFAEAGSGGPLQEDVTERDTAEPTTPAAKDSVDDSADAPSDDAPSDDVPSDEQRRENLAQVLLMLLAGVGLLGAAMIAATMIWGAKLRRTARLPESEPTQQDELWYLKSPPPTDDGPTDDGPASNGPPTDGPEQGGLGPDGRSDHPSDHRPLGQSDSPTIDGETAS